MGTVTIGADTFDVYGTTAALASYANGSLNYYAAFTAATADTKARAHVGATRAISVLDFLDVANAAVATAVTDVVTAAYELTLAAIAKPAILTQASTTTNAKKLDAKGTSIEYFGPTIGGRFPPAVMVLLDPLLGSNGLAAELGIGVSASAGTDASSDFEDCDDYSVSGAG